MIPGGLLKAASLGVNRARSEAKAAIQRAVQKAILGGIAVFLLLLAFGFGLGAFTVWLAGEVGTVQALSFVALGFVVVALIIYAIARLSGRKPDRRPEPSPIAAALNANPIDEGKDDPPGSVVGSLAVVAVVGYLMGRQMFRR